MALQVQFHAIDALVAELYPGWRVDSVQSLRPEASAGADTTAKAMGYGEPLEIVIRSADGDQIDRLVLHTAAWNEYGHDRRADRAEAMLLAFDSYGSIPGHVRAIDVGAISPAGDMRSLRDSGEFYLLTDYAPGDEYATDLRALARRGSASYTDLARCKRLADYLAVLHHERGGSHSQYARAIRDLVGHGEGIYGLVDGYPPDTPGAPPERLRRIEQLCADYRWKLRDKSSRLAKIHGDFHPFNILFDDDDGIVLLDASRGCRGDPADDVICLAINYIFFALDAPTTWRLGFGILWHRFLNTYLERTGDSELLVATPPYLAWRALVLANPNWYPNLTEGSRHRLLTWVEKVLDVGRLDPEAAEELFQ